MANTPRDQVSQYYQRRAITAGMAQPLRQGELFRQAEVQAREQTRQQTNAVMLVPTNRNVVRLNP